MIVYVVVAEYSGVVDHVAAFREEAAAEALADRLRAEADPQDDTVTIWDCLLPA